MRKKSMRLRYQCVTHIMGYNVETNCVAVTRKPPKNDRPMKKRPSQRRHRRGSVVVEFAIVAIPLFMFIFASVEFGRAMMCVQSMEEAVRSGCRAAVVKDATTDSIKAEVDSIMRMVGISEYTLDIQPPNFASIERFEPISVTVIATYDNMTWLPAPQFLAGAPFLSSCIMPKESSPDE
jgi:hypothetical protein